MAHISSFDAYKLAVDIFCHCGASDEEAQLVADHLVDANLCGVDSHEERPVIPMRVVSTWGNVAR